MSTSSLPRRRRGRAPAGRAPLPPRRRGRPPLLAVALIALAVAAVVVAATDIGGGGTTASTVTTRTATAQRGVVEQTVSGTGSLTPARELALGFGTSGTVTRVYVHAGEHVYRDEVLARIDPSQANVQLEQANAQLLSAQEHLDSIKNAESSTPTADAVTSTASFTPSRSGRKNPQATATATPKPTATATPKPAATPSPGAIASAEASVSSAELGVRQAEASVTATWLRAPMAGTVASVSGQKGSHVSGGGNAPATSSSTGFIELADLGRLTMNVSLSESDIGKVHVGESATVTIDAVAGAEEAAHVTSVAVLPTSSSSGSGAVSYPVTITLDQSTHGVRPGMSATADIVVARAHGVVVPNQALQGTTVTVQNGKKRTAQPVQVGVVGDSSTEILSGLHAGETIVVTSTSALAGRNASGSASSAANGRGNVVFGPGFGGGLRPGGFRQTVVGGGGP